MSNFSISSLSLGLLILIFVQSCILPKANHLEPDFYLLNLPSLEGNATSSDQAPVFYIREIELPQYLRDNRMVYRPSMESVEFREYKRWGEPIANGIARVLGDNLAQKLGSLTYSVYPNRRKNQCNFEIAISIKSFEKHRDQMTVLDASIEVKTGDGRILRETFKTQTKMVTPKEIDEVRALSDCLSKLADRLHSLISA